MIGYMQSVVIQIDAMVYSLSHVFKYPVYFEFGIFSR